VPAALKTVNTCSVPDRSRTHAWYKDYLALSLVPALQTYVNGPNSTADNTEIKGVVDRFMTQERDQFQHVTPDANGNAFSTDINSVNSGTTQANGDFFLSIDAHTPGVRERTYLMFNVGETVTVRPN